MLRPEGAVPCDVPRLSQPCEGITAVCGFCRRTSERPVRSGDKPTDRHSPGGTWCVGAGPAEFCPEFCRDMAERTEKPDAASETRPPTMRSRQGMAVFAALLGMAAVGDALAPAPPRRPR